MTHSHSHEHAAAGNGGERGALLIDNEVKSQNLVLKRLKIAAVLCITFIIVEVLGGWLAGSLAVLSDAAHLLADLAAFLVAIGASYLAGRPSTDQHTFGLKRMESLAALFSMVSLALVSVGLAVEAIRRLVSPPEEPVDGRLMSGIALIGVLVNVILAFVLGEHHVHMPGASHDHDHDHDHDHHGHQDEEKSYGTVHSDEVPPQQHAHDKPNRNINLHAAYLHVLGDLAQSVAVLIAGIVIWVKPNWRVVDPLCTLLFCAMVFYSTLSVLKSSISVLLEEVPPNVSWIDVHADIEKVPGVVQVHDLHIWSISHGIPTMSVHIMARNGSDRTAQQVLREVYLVSQKYGIQHATIQVQCEGNDCITCSGLPPGGQSCHSAACTH